MISYEERYFYVHCPYMNGTAIAYIQILFVTYEPVYYTTIQF